MAAVSGALFLSLWASQVRSQQTPCSTTARGVDTVHFLSQRGSSLEWPPDVDCRLRILRRHRLRSAATAQSQAQAANGLQQRGWVQGEDRANGKAIPYVEAKP